MMDIWDNSPTFEYSTYDDLDSTSMFGRSFIHSGTPYTITLNGDKLRGNIKYSANGMMLSLFITFKGNNYIGGPPLANTDTFYLKAKDTDKDTTHYVHIDLDGNKSEKLMIGESGETKEIIFNNAEDKFHAALKYGILLEDPIIEQLYELRFTTVDFWLDALEDGVKDD